MPLRDSYDIRDQNNVAQFVLYHVVAPLSFSRSINLALFVIKQERK